MLEKKTQKEAYFKLLRLYNFKFQIPTAWVLMNLKKLANSSLYQIQRNWSNFVYKLFMVF